MNGRQAKALRKAARSVAKTEVGKYVHTTTRYERLARALSDWCEVHGRHAEPKTILRLGKWRTLVLLTAKKGVEVREGPEPAGRPGAPLQPVEVQSS